MNNHSTSQQAPVASKSLPKLRSPQKNCGFYEGDEVVVLKSKFMAQVGRVRCIFQDAKNRWILGIEFEKPIGDSDGTYKGQQMFSCNPKYGVFCEANEALPRHYYEASTKIEPNLARQYNTVPKTLQLEEPNSNKSLSTRPSPRIKQKSANSAFDEAFKQTCSLASISNCEIESDASPHSQNLSTVNENRPKCVSSPFSLNGESSYRSVVSSPEEKSRSPTPLSTKEIDESLEVGSMVQVTKSGYIYYGVIKWIGNLPSKKYLCAGLELEEELISPPSNDGIYEGIRYFTCPPQHALFCYLHDCRKDNRFQEIPVKSNAPYFGPNQSLDVHGHVRPSKHLHASQLGRVKGIQGNNNSCYLDATLFAMFAFHEAFDFLFKIKLKDPDCCEVQRILKDAIVNPLRSTGYVSAEHTFYLRKLLDKISCLDGLETEEKEPEEILNVVLDEVFQIEPLLSFKNGITDEDSKVNLCQILLERSRDDSTIPDTQSLLTKYFVSQKLYFQNRPRTLLLQVPRSGKDFKVFHSVLPSTTLQIGGLCGGVWGNCFICGKKPYFKCASCYLERDFKAKFSAVPFCEKCCTVVHNHPDRSKHKPVPATTPRHGIRMNLVAVLCIHTSHYVAYCRVPAPVDSTADLIQLHGEEGAPGKVLPQKKYTWVFFDSMAGREVVGGCGGYTVPLVEECPQLEEWLNNPGRLLHDTQDVPDYVTRLIKDALLCFYTHDS